MKLYATTIAALFGLLMMAMPSVASAEIVRVYPRTAHPVVVQEVVAPAPFTTVEYYRPWACSNPYYRRHQWWRCR
jgi:hypothetical protein